MRVLRRVSLILVSAVLLVSSISFIATANEGIVADESSQLKKDIAIMNQLTEDETEEFYKNNKEWIEEVNQRLDEYLAEIPEKNRTAALNNLTGVNPKARAYSGNFNWTEYAPRGGKWTYSMYPKASTRWLKSVAVEGWNELVRKYGIRSEVNSLYNQYICHFDAFIEMQWDIEKGRPDVGYWNTIMKFCNP